MIERNDLSDTPVDAGTNLQPQVTARRARRRAIAKIAISMDCDVEPSFDDAVWRLIDELNFGRAAIVA